MFSVLKLRQEKKQAYKNSKSLKNKGNLEAISRKREFYGSIERSRKGCLCCKKRKKKCDEEFPTCGACYRRQEKCRWEDKKGSREKQNHPGSPQNGELITKYLGCCLDNDFESEVSVENDNGLRGGQNDTEKDRVVTTRISLLSESVVSNYLFNGVEFCIVDRLVKDLLKNACMSEIYEKQSLIPSQSIKRRISLEHNVENMLLKHFFEKVLPIADAHSNSPWSNLILRYCDLDMARSCFIALASIHLHKGRNEIDDQWYSNGLFHISNVSEFLLETISTNFISLQPAEKTSENNCAVVLLLVCIYIIFTLIESGKSSTSRHFFEVFSKIVKQNFNYQNGFTNLKDHNLIFLLVVLSWFDTVSAICSVDFRKPYCEPDWYSAANGEFSTLDVMGCPPEIFTVLWSICDIRHDLHTGIKNSNDFEKEKELLTKKLINYRSYVVKFERYKDYLVRLRCAQCWSIAAYISLLKLFDPKKNAPMVQALVHEFMDIYVDLDPAIQIVNQMVWPLFIIGSNCMTESERRIWSSLPDRLYNITHTGTVETIKRLVQECWNRDNDMETVLYQLHIQNIDFLPL